MNQRKNSYWDYKKYQKYNNADLQFHEIKQNHTIITIVWFYFVPYKITQKSVFHTEHIKQLLKNTQNEFVNIFSNVRL